MGPLGRNARLKDETISPAVKTEDRLENGLIEPARRAGVPRPASATHMGRVAVHVSGQDIRLNPVTLDPFRILSMEDRVEDLQELECEASLPEEGGRLHDPDGRMSVLAAVLADARADIL